MRRQPLILALIATTLAVSLAAVFDPVVGDALALVPAKVFRGQLWRLATWIFYERSALGMVFSCITLYMFGGDLLSAWGRRRFVRYVGGIVVGAAAGACVLSLLVPNADWYPCAGGVALGDALVIGWALQFPSRQVLIYRILPLGGDQLAYGTLGLTVVFIIFYGLTPFAPDLIAGVAALAYMKRWWDRPTPKAPPPRERGPYWVN